MTSINDLMDELESEIKYIRVDGELVNLKTVIDRILSEDKLEKRELSEG